MIRKHIYGYLYAVQIKNIFWVFFIQHLVIIIGLDSHGMLSGSSLEGVFINRSSLPALRETQMCELSRVRMSVG